MAFSRARSSMLMAVELKAIRSASSSTAASTTSKTLTNSSICSRIASPAAVTGSTDTTPGSGNRPRWTSSVDTPGAGLTRTVLVMPSRSKRSAWPMSTYTRNRYGLGWMASTGNSVSTSW